MEQIVSSLLPFKTVPAFRSGSLTPWGGEKLNTLYHKSAPPETPGESLEVSCIPGLESMDSQGNTLPEMIDRFGERLVGGYAGKPFPLLLKIIDAREALSVQVHPDNGYAACEGKLGKTEAWLILDAAPGAELIYGLQPGVTHAQLEAAFTVGGPVSGLLRRVPVKAGDVVYIPAGCVHAIGAGITLYEIQQSSDITYRFYDWDRRDKAGNARPLHIRQALEVTDVSFRQEPLKSSGAPVDKVIANEYFSLFLLNVNGRIGLPPVPDFGMVTSFADSLTLLCGESRLTLNNGETAFLPRGCDCTLSGSGTAALSMPAPAR